MVFSASFAAVWSLQLWLAWAFHITFGAGFPFWVFCANMTDRELWNVKIIKKCKRLWSFFVGTLGNILGVIREQKETDVCLLVILLNQLNRIYGWCLNLLTMQTFGSPASVCPSQTQPVFFLMKVILFRNKSVAVQGSVLQHMSLPAGDNLEVISEQRGSVQGTGSHPLAAMSGLISDLWVFCQATKDSSIQL